MRTIRKVGASAVHTAVRPLVRARPPTSVPIFVTGNGRSGTSWIGQTLGYAPGVMYFREPCHPALHGHSGEAADRIWSKYVPPAGHGDYFERSLSRAFAGELGNGSRTRLGDAPRRLLHPPRVVVKEVAAFLSLDWVWRRWQPDVLIIVRHPCAYVSSVQQLGQDQAELERFSALRANEDIQGHLSDALAAHLRNISDPLEATAASWAIRHHINLRLKPSRPPWHVVRYEDLAADPAAQFRGLFERFGLTFDETVAARIEENTTSAAPGPFTTSRVSASRIDSWRRKLDPGQVDRVRHVVEPFGLPVYAQEEDW